MSFLLYLRDCIYVRTGNVNDDVMHVLFTGTGAGLGAYVANALRDTYPTATLMNHCVWPYESGEVIVQSYNTLLTLSSLLDASDGVCIVQNEELVRFYFYLHTKGQLA